MDILMLILHFAATFWWGEKSQNPRIVQGGRALSRSFGPKCLLEQSHPRAHGTAFHLACFEYHTHRKEAIPHIQVELPEHPFLPVEIWYLNILCRLLRIYTRVQSFIFSDFNGSCSPLFYVSCVSNQKWKETTAEHKTFPFGFSINKMKKN